MSDDEKLGLLPGSRKSYGSTPNKASSDVHCHNNSTGETQLDKKARRKLLIASLLCLLFMIGEAVGGILANSLAIATDAAHLLTDFASFMISLFAIYLASRPATKKMSFGWHRAEVMGALISVLLIWVVTGVLVYMAIVRVSSGEYEIEATVMLITAGVGVGVNLIMGCTLHDHGHSHGGSSHSHNKNSKSENKRLTDPPSAAENGEVHTHEEKQNINVRAAFIHVVGDFIQSLGVLVAAIIIFFKPEWKIADPICTFLFSLLVLGTTMTILRDTLNVLMEGTPRGIAFNDVKIALCELKGVKEVHNLRIWCLTLNRAAVAVHLATDGTISPHEAMVRASAVMRENFGVDECTIQVEQFTPDMADCQKCQDPED